MYPTEHTTLQCYKLKNDRRNQNAKKLEMLTGLVSFQESDTVSRHVKLREMDLREKEGRYSWVLGTMVSKNIGTNVY